MQYIHAGDIADDKPMVHADSLGFEQDRKLMIINIDIVMEDNDYFSDPM